MRMRFNAKNTNLTGRPHPCVYWCLIKVNSEIEGLRQGSCPAPAAWTGCLARGCERLFGAFSFYGVDLIKKIRYHIRHL